MNALWCVVLLVPGILAKPIEDSIVVGSVVREVRAAPPIDLKPAATNDDYHNDGYQGDDGSVGYLKKSEDGGADGYKHFDSYHKKDGDKYGYEKHTAFGKAQKYVDDSDNKKNKDDKVAKGTHQSYQVAEEYDDSPAEINEYSSYESDGGDGAAAHYTEGGNSGESAAFYGGPAGYTNDEGDENEEYNEESESDY